MAAAPASAEQSFSTDHQQSGQHTESEVLFVDHSIYKSNCAASFKAILPTWEPTQGGGRTIKRTGVLLLEMAVTSNQAPASSGNRTYDWQNKQIFALSALELAELIDMGQGRRSTPIELFHDPSKAGAPPGVTKSLKVARKDDPAGNTYFLNLYVKENGKQAPPMGLPLTQAEMTVMCTLSSYLIPRLLGFDALGK